MHMRGLQKLVENRGGIQTFTEKSNSWLIISMISADIHGALVSDCLPLFEKSFLVAGGPSLELSYPFFTSISRSLADLSEDLYDVSRALDYIVRMTQDINSKASSHQIEVEIGATKSILPVAYQVLHLPRNLNSSYLITPINQIQLLREIVRLSCVIYLIMAKQIFCPGLEGDPEIGNRLLHLLRIYQPYWTTTLLPLKLWIHAALMSVQEQLRMDDVNVEEFRSTMRELELYSWSDVLVLLKSVVWIEGYAARKLQILCDSN